MSGGEARIRETDAFVRRILNTSQVKRSISLDATRERLTEDAVEAFQEGLAIDEPKPRVIDRSDVSDDEIDTVRIATHQSVQSTLKEPYELKRARVSMPEN